MTKGLMIVFDGSNGAGKTTVITGVVQYLTELGYEVIQTREPGGTVIGEKIREVILDPSTPEMCPIAELMLFGAGRAQHIQQKIIPALEAGKIVISDRFDSATYSFQHYARGLDFALVKSINDIAIQGFSPDKTIILDLDPLEGLKRVQNRGEGLDRLEDEQMDFLVRAREGYLTQAKQSPEKFAVIDAAKTPAEVFAAVKQEIDFLLKK